MSVLAAFCLNMVLSLNHRPERYILPGITSEDEQEEASPMDDRDSATSR